MRFATRAIHAGQGPDPSTGATIVPIYQTSTFTQAAPGDHLGFEYSRSGNPTRAALETALASLEGAAHGMAFASGLAAENTVFSLLATGDHVIASEDLYGGTVRLLETTVRTRGVDVTYVDGSSRDSFAAAMRPETRMIWVETPSNPLLHLTDIASVAGVAHGGDAILAVDNTFATPYLQQPISLGADIIVHSTTKYIGGHSDAVGGAVVTDDREIADRVRFHQNAAGGVPGPFDSWLILRGLKTLAIRMREHQMNARLLAEHVSRASGVEAVYYPGLPSHPQAELAARQMSGPGGMLSLRLAGDRAAALRFLRALRVFSLAESLGGVESLACYPSEMTHAWLSEAERERRGIGGGLVRLSVGIEDIEDLIADVDTALAAARAG